MATAEHVIEGAHGVDRRIPGAGAHGSHSRRGAETRTFVGVQPKQGVGRREDGRNERRRQPETRARARRRRGFAFQAHLKDQSGGLVALLSESVVRRGRR
jgi:hypothetical protein